MNPQQVVTEDWCRCPICVLRCWLQFVKKFHPILVYYCMLLLQVIFFTLNFSIRRSMNATLGPNGLWQRRKPWNFFDDLSVGQTSLFGGFSEVLSELSLDSTWVLIGSWLFCIHHLPCSVSFWCVLEGSVKVLSKEHAKLVHWRWTHFGMPRGAKMGSTHQCTEIGCSIFKCKHYLRACTRSANKCMHHNQWETVEDQLQAKVRIELNDNSTILSLILISLFS